MIPSAGIRPAGGPASPEGPLAVPTVSIVVPAYNEERRLGRLLDTLRTTAATELAAAGLELSEVVIVDDGSTDATPAMLADAATRDRALVALVTGAGNAGKGAALASGVRVARGELTLLCDVDLSTPLGEVAKLYERLRAGADLAIGSRDLPGSRVLNAPEHRKHVGRTFNFLVRRLTGLPFRDTQCGFKLMTTATARTLLERQLVPGYAFDVEVLMRARALDLAVAEVPVVYVHDLDSKVNPLSASPRMALDVARLAYRMRRFGASPR